MKAPWELKLLGRFQLRRGHQVVERFRSRQTVLLLAYLAYYPDRPHPREELVELLWPEAEPRAGRQRLNIALSSLRHSLRDPAGGCVFLTDRETVRLRPQAISPDTAQFEATLRAAKRAGSDPERVQLLREAVERYSGPFLPGHAEAWVLQERAWLTERFFQALGELLTHLESTGQVRDAVEAARRGVVLDPLREEAQRDLIRTLAAAGRADAALQQYRQWERRLAEELEAEPSEDLRALVGEIRSPPPRPLPREHDGYLPAQITRFFGREEEIASVSALLAEGVRLLTLLGPGGSGKTRLAVEVGQRLRERFHGAVWFVPLQELNDAGRVLEQIRDILDLPRTASAEPLEQVVAFLSDQPALLILDNCEHLAEELAGRVEALLHRCRLLTVLATSRQRLGIPGERVLTVGPLPVPVGGEQWAIDRGKEADCSSLATLLQCPSVALFVDRAQAVRPDFYPSSQDATTLAELCTRLEGLPLALELAAARSGVLTPRQILNRLSEYLDLLSARHHGGDPRHRSLRAALDWSYHLLTPELQRFFARLSVFRGGWDIEAVEAVCEEALALDYLEQLRDCSLVVTEEAGPGTLRFRLLEMLRGYAAEKLRLEDQAAVARRHADHYLALVERARSETGASLEENHSLDSLEIELPNFRAVLAFLADRGQTDGGESALQALRLGGNLWPLWSRRGYWAEGRERLTALLAMSHNTGRTPERAEALQGLGWFAAVMGDIGAARRWYEASLSIWREVGDRCQAGHLLYHVAHMYHLEDNYEPATALMEEAREIWAELGDRSGLAAVRDVMGGLAYRHGDYATARAMWEETLVVQREQGDRRAIANRLWNIALAAQCEGDDTAAVPLLQESLSLARDIGEKRLIALCLYNLSRVNHLLGDEEAARTLGGECLEIRRGLQDKPGTREALQLLGEVLAWSGDHSTAQSLLEQSLEAGPPGAPALISLGRLARTRGSRTAAEQYYREGLRIARDDHAEQPQFGRDHCRDEIARCLVGLAAVGIESGGAATATRLLAAAATVRNGVKLSQPATERAETARLLDLLRAVLDETAFEAAWVEGGAWSLEQAVAFGLQEPAHT